MKNKENSIERLQSPYIEKLNGKKISKHVFLTYVDCTLYVCFVLCTMKYLCKLKTMLKE